MRVLILDDEQIRHDYFSVKYEDVDHVHVYTGEEALDILRREPSFDVATLDHDLGGGMNGAAVARAMVDPEQLPKDKLPPLVVVHSFNFYGARDMVATFQAAGIKSYWERFGY